MFHHKGSSAKLCELIEVQTQCHPHIVTTHFYLLQLLDLPILKKCVLRLYGELLDIVKHGNQPLKTEEAIGTDTIMNVDRYMGRKGLGGYGSNAGK